MRRLAVAVAVLAAVIVLLLAVPNWIVGPRATLPPAPPTAALTPSAAAAVAPSAARSRVGLPDPQRTPGTINPNVTQDDIATTICKSGWTQTIRPPAAYTGALKTVQILEYGYSDRDRSHYQEDHLIPLELGGAPRDPRNLWPEPNTIALPDGTAVGSDAKDHLENALRREVCAGTLALLDAQRMIATDWIAAWQQYGRP